MAERCWICLGAAGKSVGKTFGDSETSWWRRLPGKPGVSQSINGRISLMLEAVNLSTRAGRPVAAGRATLTGGQAGGSQHILPLTWLQLVFQWPSIWGCLFMVKKRLNIWKTSDTKDMDTWEKRRETERQVPGQHGEPRTGWRPGIWENPSNQAITGLWWSTRILCHWINEEIQEPVRLRWSGRCQVIPRRSEGPRYTPGSQWKKEYGFWTGKQDLEPRQKASVTVLKGWHDSESQSDELGSLMVYPAPSQG